MTEDHILTLRAVLMNTQGTTETLVWRDVDGGIHEVVGFNPRYKEHAEDHLSEPAFITKGGGAVAALNTEPDRFFLLEPVFVP